MARPIGNAEPYLSQPGTEGIGDPIGRSMIPNGQPPQFPRQPVYPEKASRPMLGHHMKPPLSSNGIQQYSHPSSLSSHSSRDVSPVPRPMSNQPSPNATPPPTNPAPRINGGNALPPRHMVPPNSAHPPSRPGPSNIPSSSDGQQRLPAQPPGAVKPSYQTPSYTSSQPKPSPAQSNPSGYTPMQSNSTPSYSSTQQQWNQSSGHALVSTNPNLPAQSSTASDFVPVSYAALTSNLTLSNVPAATYPTAASQSNPTSSFTPVSLNSTSGHRPVASVSSIPAQPKPTPGYAPAQSNQPSSFMPVQLNSTSGLRPVQSNPNMQPHLTSTVPVQSNPTSSYVPVSSNPSMQVQSNPISSYVPVSSNQSMSVQSNPTSSYMPVSSNQSMSVQSNPTSSYVPVSSNQSMPVQSNPTSSYMPVSSNQSMPAQSHPHMPSQPKPLSAMPVQPNPTPSYMPVSTYASMPAQSYTNVAAQSKPTPSYMPVSTYPAQSNTTPTHASMPGNTAPQYAPASSMTGFPPRSFSPKAVPNVRGAPNPLQQQPVQSRMASYGTQPRYNGPAMPPTSRPPMMQQGQNIGQPPPLGQNSGQPPPLGHHNSAQPPPLGQNIGNPPLLGQNSGQPPPLGHHKSAQPPPLGQNIGNPPPLGQNIGHPPPLGQNIGHPPLGHLSSTRPPPLGQNIGQPPPLGQNGPPQQGVAPPMFSPPLAQNGPSEGGALPKRYPQQPGQRNTDANFNQQLAGLSVSQHGFSKLWGAEHFDLLATRNILPAEKVEVPRVKLQQEFLDAVNCSPEIFRCTLTKIPETNSLLQKSRLPLGVLIHPFKDLNHLAVIQCQSIVRCRACRTYINPFVYFVDHKRWKCNLCFRVNELPEEFQFDPVSKTYGDPSRRPEIKSATIEFIAPSEYMLRPPQPAVYLFLLDVSCLASECGYLPLVCATLLDEMDKLPGDGRTQVGFLAYDSALHFYSLADGLNQPQEMTVMDVDDVFLPCPDSLVVNLNENKELVKDLLRELPKRFAKSHDSNSCLGAALQAAFKLMSATGGRVTVFQACLPNIGPGALASREVPSARASKDVAHLTPATDFYKRLALDCSGQQVAVDLFVVNQQYCDLATLAGAARYSGGCVHHFPLFKSSDRLKCDALEQALRRYLTRKLGLEAVMRIRCSRGLSVHTFHGHFFVRSTDLLSLPNVNPDAGFAMQVALEESLTELQTVCFQAALLYTSTKGERRIRVHTLCLPVAANLTDILHSADQHAIVGLLSKMAADRAVERSLGEAREALINAAVDALSAFKMAQPAAPGLAAPASLRLLPLMVLALLKHVAFRTGQSTRLDDRVFAMCQMKSLPLATLVQEVYPDLYPVHRLLEQACIDVDGTPVAQPPRLHLSAEKLESNGAFLLDGGSHMILFVGRGVGPTFCQGVFGVGTFQEIQEDMVDLPQLDTPESESLRNFVAFVQSDKPYPATLEIIRDDSQDRNKFYERLLEDRTESSLSYYEFLQHLKTNVK